MEHYSSDVFKTLFGSGVFDFFSWVPTVRGKLSLACMNDKNQIHGLTDKILFNFQINSDSDFNSKYFATSFLTADFDSQVWPNNYSGIYRYTLLLSQGSQNHIKYFLDRLNIKSNNYSDLYNLFGKSFIGNLYVTHSENSYIPQFERNVLSDLLKIENLNNQLTSQLINNSSVYKSIDSLNLDLKNCFLNLEKVISLSYDQDNDDVYRKEFIKESITKEKQYRIYKYRVFLTEEGLLFLKNDTSKFFMQDLQPELLPKGIIPRPITMACLHVKQIFHSHYHHKRENDAFIHVENLNHENRPSVIGQNQIDYLTLGVIKEKRNRKFGSHNHAGILSYAGTLNEMLFNARFLSSEQKQINTNILKNIQDDVTYVKEGRKLLKHFVMPGSLTNLILWMLPFIGITVSITQFLYNSSNPLQFNMRCAVLALSSICAVMLYHLVAISTISENFIYTFGYLSKYFKRIRYFLLYLIPNNFKGVEVQGSYGFFLKLYLFKQQWVLKLRRDRLAKIILITFIIAGITVVYKIFKIINTPSQDVKIEIILNWVEGILV